MIGRGCQGIGTVRSAKKRKSATNDIVGEAPSNVSIVMLGYALLAVNAG